MKPEIFVAVRSPSALLVLAGRAESLRRMTGARDCRDEPGGEGVQPASQVHCFFHSLYTFHMTNFERTGGQTVHSCSQPHQKQGITTLVRPGYGKWLLRTRQLIQNHKFLYAICCSSIGKLANMYEGMHLFIIRVWSASTASNDDTYSHCLNRTCPAMNELYKNLI